jgi:hypothetical protein
MRVAMKRWGGVAVGLVCGSGSAALGGVVYSQPSTSNPANVGFGYFSHSAPRPTRNFRHADNFTLAAPASVSSVNWWGISGGVISDDLSNFDTFTVQFYSSKPAGNGNPIPDALLFQETFAKAATGATATGRSAPNGAMEFRHSVGLSAPVNLSAGALYFLSVSAHCIQPNGEAWLWQDADVVDDYSVSFSYASQQWRSSWIRTVRLS